MVFQPPSLIFHRELNMTLRFPQVVEPETGDHEQAARQNFQIGHVSSPNHGSPLHFLQTGMQFLNVSIHWLIWLLRVSLVLKLRVITIEKSETPPVAEAKPDGFDVGINKPWVMGATAASITCLRTRPSHELIHEIPFVGKVIGEIALGNANLSGDVGKRSCGITLLIEEPQTDFQDPLTRCQAVVRGLLSLTTTKNSSLSFIYSANPA
ncbi:MAG: hypothetical protein QGI81_11205 [Pseudomonadales bacterium]|jgi:hypothetical protein|nr:hypothetical protein [Pseudomonadales bacterium]|tara:strand:+ start:1133 stop:1759 length:627 start_codon:yes stop_codon:yes gene_type:complete